MSGGLGGDLAAGNVVLGGSRDIDLPEQQLIDNGVITLAAVGPDLIADLRRAVGDRPVTSTSIATFSSPVSSPPTTAFPGASPSTISEPSRNCLP